MIDASIIRSYQTADLFGLMALRKSVPTQNELVSNAVRHKIKTTADSQ